MTDSQVVDNNIQAIHTTRFPSQFPGAFRLTPTIGDLQAQVAQESFRRTSKRNSQSIHPLVSVDRMALGAVTVVRQEACPYCRSMAYEVSYRSASGALHISGVCSDCGYRAQSHRGGPSNPH